MPYLKNDTDSPSDSDLDSGTFEKLVQDLSAVLGPSSGLDSADVDPMTIQRLMEKYISRESEWGSFALADASRTYTRNLIDEGNGKSNLVSRYIEYTADDVACVLSISYIYLVETLDANLTH